MSSPAKKAGEIKVSFLVARARNGKLFAFLPTPKPGLEAVEIIEDSDAVLDLHDKLKKLKGRVPEGEFVQSALFVRPKTNRRLKFA